MSKNPLPFDSVLTIRDVKIQRGHRWVYCAGFNVDLSLKDTLRIDCEIEDIAYLLSQGARIAILSHQGSYRKGTAIHLNFVAEYLSKRLQKPVRYFSENSSEQAVRWARSLNDGEVALFGNTRFHQGEEEGDECLAAQFSRLGDFVAVGGFSKAHRVHASNVKILSFLPGYATTNLLKELKNLSEITLPFQGKSAVILGGIKLEKIEKGLHLFKDIYDLVIPGGAVLNHILKEMGFDIGDSILCDESELASQITSEIVSTIDRAPFLLPEEVIIAEKDSKSNPKKIALQDGVPKGFAIVDFVVSEKMEESFLALNQSPVRLLIAGTPCLIKHGFRTSADAFLRWQSRPKVTSFMMGGDTLSDFSLNGPSSVGGGAALYYLKEKSCPLIEVLIANQFKRRSSFVF